MEKAVSVRVIRPYIIEVAFDDGTRRVIDMESELWGEVFVPLRDPALFAQAAVDQRFGSVYWPTGADLAPEFLLEHPRCPDEIGVGRGDGGACREYPSSTGSSS